MNNILQNVRSTSKTIPLSAVRPSAYNPPCRTENKTGDIDELAADIDQNGQLNPIAVVHVGGGVYDTADGHRRRAALLKLGHKEVKAIVYEGGENPRAVIDALFVTLNENTRAFGNRAKVEAGIKGGPMFDTNARATVGYLVKIFGGNVPQIVKDSAGTYVVSVAKRVTEYCYPTLERGTSEFDSKVRVVLLWLIRNKQQQKSIAYMRNGFSARILKNAIESNQLAPKVNG